MIHLPTHFVLDKIQLSPLLNRLYLRKRFNFRLSGLILMLLFIYTGCTNDTGDNVDMTPPKVYVQSPILLLEYSTDIGNDHVPYRVTFQAQAADETKMRSFRLTVTDSKGTIVLEKISESNSDTDYILGIKEIFQTTHAGNYKAEFTATDANGNITSDFVNFSYKD